MTGCLEGLAQDGQGRALPATCPDYRLAPSPPSSPHRAGCVAASVVEPQRDEQDRPVSKRRSRPLLANLNLSRRCSYGTGRDEGAGANRCESGPRGLSTRTHARVPSQCSSSLCPHREVYTPLSPQVVVVLEENGWLSQSLVNAVATLLLQEIMGYTVVLHHTPDLQVSSSSARSHHRAKADV